MKAPRTLEPAEVQHRVRVVNAEIGRCYLAAAGDQRGAGRLQITLAIARNGLLDRVEVAMPGLPANAAKQVDGCVRAAVASLRFPARRAPTTALVPYFYQRTAAPGAGPQLSRWNPKGCR